jgi:MYXO-CTERM domain-containing protein
MKSATWMSLVTCVAMAGMANAVPVTFVFDPNDLLDRYATTPGPRETQEDARLIVDYRTEPREYFAGTYTGDLLTQPFALNSYENWLESLGPGEGMSSFIMWVVTDEYPNNPYNTTWNQEIYRDGSLGNSADGISATAAAGWNAQVIDIYAGTYGVWWSTDDPALYLRPTAQGGAELGHFSFTMEDTNAQPGEEYRVWFGSGGAVGSGIGGLVFDDEGWGTRSPAYEPFSDGPDDFNARWNGIVMVRATAVPDGGVTAMMLALVLAMLGGMRRRSR